MTRMINFYNQEVERFSRFYTGFDKKLQKEKVDGFLDSNPTKISWTRGLKQELLKGRNFKFDAECITTALYRPFTKQFMYFNRRFNEMVLKMPQIFPNSTIENLVICVSGVGARSGFTVLMADALPSLDTVEKWQCFPLKIFEELDLDDPRRRDFSSPIGGSISLENVIGKNATEDFIADLFANEGSYDLYDEDGNLYDDYELSDDGKHLVYDGITDAGLSNFQAAYPGETIGKEDLFYYVYGLLHSPDYRERYADNLSKELPRIPCVKTAADFWAFSQAGRQLADLHLNYETVEPYPATVTGDTGKLIPAQYRVEKMKYGKQGKDKDLSTVHYNALITVSGIPLEAYEYVVNGKSAIDWVMERQCFKVDKDSGIVNDANDWAVETMGNPRYPLELLLRVVTVSVETVKIVKGLPKLDI
jgi:predicted helicase